MKTLHHNAYKIIVMMLLFPLLATAQTKREYLESFEVEQNPELHLNLSHAEVIITTWNKNKVEVKTTLQTDNLSEKEAKAYFDTNPIMVLGNKSRVEVKSAPKGITNYQINSPRGLKPPSPPSLHLEKFPKPPQPPKPSFDINFDYEAFKENGKVYLDNFKQQLDSSGFRQEMKLFRDEMLNWREDMLKERSEMMSFRDQQDSITSDAIIYRFKIDSLLKNTNSKRSNSIKKIIEISVPKSSILDLDLRHSQLQVEQVKKVKGELTYTDAIIKSITGVVSQLNLKYSSLTINMASELKLDLNYSKKVIIDEVHALNVKSNMSQLQVSSLKNKAIIKGSYGELSILEIDPGFSLIDIQLEKSTATLHLPQTIDYDFYAKSSNSKLNMNAELDIEMNRNFGDIIYTNNAKADTSKRVSLTADYSTINLK